MDKDFDAIRENLFDDRSDIEKFLNQHIANDENALKKLQKTINLVGPFKPSQVGSTAKELFSKSGKNAESKLRCKAIIRVIYERKYGKDDEQMDQYILQKLKSINEGTYEWIDEKNESANEKDFRRENKRDAFNSIFTDKSDGYHSELRTNQKLLVYLYDDLYIEADKLFRELGFSVGKKGRNRPTISVEEKDQSHDQGVRFDHAKSKIALDKSESSIALQLIKKMRRAVHSQMSSEIIGRTPHIEFLTEMNWQEVGSSEKDFISKTLNDVISATEAPIYGSLSIVLGGVGTGKSLALRNYALELIKHTKNKVPLFISLSRWESNLTFDEFLRNEARKIFHGPQKELKKLFDSQAFIFILDGLDERPGQAIAIDFEDILDFSHNYQVVLSCREGQFNDVPIPETPHVKLFRLLPFDRDQIAFALIKSTQKEKILALLDKQQSLWEFAEVPLLLSNLVNLSPHDLETIVTSWDADTSDDTKLDSLWEQVMIEAMGEKKISSDPEIKTLVTMKSSRSDAANRRELRQFLIWVSQSIDSNDFYIENIQPNWLRSSSEKWIYVFVSRIISCAALFASIGLFMSGPWDYLLPGSIAGVMISILFIIRPSFLVAKARSNNQSHTAALRGRVVGNFFYLFLLFGSFLITYFALSTPRKPDDFILNGVFSVTEAYAGAFCTFFFSVIFAVRFSWQTLEKDIKPVERLRVSWKGFFFYGICGGLLIGTLCAFAAYLILQYFPESTFGDWLGRMNERTPYGTVLLGGVTGLIFGFFATAAFGYLDSTKTWMNTKERTSGHLKPNYGIRRSALNSLFSTITATLLFAFLSGGLFFLLINPSLETFIRGAEQGAALGLMVGLWYGGFDVIQHVTLKLVFFLRGYASLQFSQHLADAKRLGLINHSGSSFSFYHDTLRKYLSREALPATTPSLAKRNLWKSLIVLITLSCLIPPLVNILNWDHYWSSSNEVKVIFDSRLPIVENSPGKFDAIEDVTLTISANSDYKIGNFAGWINSEGTEVGFLGYNIGDEWDFVSRYAHASLLAIRGMDTLQVIPKDHVYWPWENRSNTISLKKGEDLRFLINDKEYQNNIGEMVIYLR